MPKPLFGDNGSGMHAHQSLWEGRQAVVSRRVRYGLVRHRPALHRRHPAPRAVAAGVHEPDGELYKRLVPGYEAPDQPGVQPAQPARPACIPITGNNPKAKRLEFRFADSSGNPYLAFAAMLMAGIDGIKKKIEPLAPVDKDLYGSSRRTRPPTSRRRRPRFRR